MIGPNGDVLDVGVFINSLRKSINTNMSTGAAAGGPDLAGS